MTVPANRLSRAEIASSGDIVTFAYGPDGTRIAKSATAAATLYPTPDVEISGGAVRAHYPHMGERRPARMGGHRMPVAFGKPSERWDAAAGSGDPAGIEGGRPYACAPGVRRWQSQIVGVSPPCGRSLLTLHRDHLASVRFVTDASANLVESTGYAAYGERLNAGMTTQKGEEGSAPADGTPTIWRSD